VLLENIAAFAETLLLARTVAVEPKMKTKNVTKIFEIFMDTINI
jgi:hypothetical protein